LKKGPNVKTKFLEKFEEIELFMFMNLNEQISRIKEVMGLSLLSEQTSKPTITDNGFEGTYEGPEFNSQGDIAHQFSNTASNLIGERLKELYDMGKYSKVDFDNIEMTTDGMGSGYVTYSLKIPFVRVNDKCDAYTSFDHRGGWGHGEGKKKQDVIRELGSLPVKGTDLDISDVKKTDEGLVEYWVQWKNPQYQSECGSSDSVKNINISVNNPSDLRTKLRGIGIKYDINVEIDNGVNISYKETGDKNQSLSYIYSNAGEKDAVLEKVKQSNDISKEIPYDVGNVEGYIIVINR